MFKDYRITMDYNEFNYVKLRKELKDNNNEYASWYIQRKNKPSILNSLEKYGELNVMFIVHICQIN